MYKVIVVDDEDIIREGIVQGVEWDSMGFEVVAGAANGLEAIDKIQECRPDIVLTDIKMPKMDGIELTEYICSNFPDIKIVILSGYSEVEYLRQAIKNKVTDYLLKPTCYEEFEAVFKNLKESLDEERQKDEEYARLKKQLIESLPFMRDKFLAQLVKGYYHDFQIIEEKKKFYEIELIGSKYAAILLEIDNYQMFTKDYSEEKKQLLLLSIVHIANRVMDEIKQGLFFLDNNDEIIGICSLDAGTKAVTTAIQEIQKSVFEYKRLTLSAGISNECDDIRRMSVFYKQAVEAVKQKVFLGSESIVFFRDIEMSDSDLLYCIFDNQAIINAVCYTGGAGIKALVDDVFKQFEAKILKRYEYIDNLCLELLFQISRYIQQFNVRMEDILSEKETAMFDICRLDSLDSKQDWLLGILYKTREKISQLRGDSTNRLIEEVKAYVRQNFGNNGMSLDSVAEKVNKNTAYLSKLFKSETGENFIDYLTRQRIERSKELLKDISNKTYEISSMVGYADVSHFTKIFKKHVGLSPSEFRNLHGKACDKKQQGAAGCGIKY